MRFLGIGETCDLAALYLRLAEDGHEVKIHITHPLASGTLAGWIERTHDWRAELDWVRAAGQDGIILFEAVSNRSGELQDELRAAGYNVIGGCAYGDRLENDRAYAQRLLADAGLKIARVLDFADRPSALRFVTKHPGRYVLKLNATDASHANYVGRLRDGSDVAALLRQPPRPDERAGLVLMEYLDGIEMGVGAYFNGEHFLSPACLDWEHKRFFPGDLGELTGEMGTIVTYRRTHSFFERTLARLGNVLRDNRYVGYINLNTIVNEAGVWPLELTCRFGYPGFAILEPLQNISWAELFGAMIRRDRLAFETVPGFTAGIVMTTPPFPYTRDVTNDPVGLPIVLDGAISPEDRRNLHFCEMGLEHGEPVTAGVYGWTMVVTGTGATIASAQERANALARRVIVPNLRYRTDIGAKLIAGDYATLERWHYLG